MCYLWKQYSRYKEDIMNKNKITILALVAFVGGMFSHSQLYARIQPPVAELPLQMKSIQFGKASWYSRHDPGINKRTANNEIFNDQALTAAMWNVPFHQLVKVTNLDNGKSVIVRVNDRGPHKRFVRRGRAIDLSRQAFTQIASPRRGLINVQIELL